jgi:riboflavin kinase/FMN adenylyltransferase
MLGRPFSFDLPVIHGKSLGRHLGAPTINQQIPKESLIPAHGVYASRATVGGETYVSITNIGTNPTVSEGDAIHCETHLLNFKGDLYGERVTTELLKFLRPERSFADGEALRQQIAKDIRQALDYHA